MPDDPTGNDLAAGDFKRHQLASKEIEAIMDTFGAEGLVTDVLLTVNDGKEATVYQCRAHPGTGVAYLAAKVYRARKFRAFRGDSGYLDGQVVGDARTARAIRNRSTRGMRMAHHLWVDREWDALRLLFDAGADVPRPWSHGPDMILMEHVGDAGGSAPRLIDTRLAPADAGPALDRILANVETMLRCDRVHGDLSAYNVLVAPPDGQVCLIDLPQSLDARTAPDAYALLTRDVRNVCDHFRTRYGTDTDGWAVARDLWERYLRCDL